MVECGVPPAEADDHLGRAHVIATISLQLGNSLYEIFVFGRATVGRRENLNTDIP